MFCKVLCEKLSSTIKIFGIFRKAVAAVGAVVCDWLGESMKMFLALDLHPGPCWGAEYLQARPGRPQPPEQRSKNASVAGGLSHS